MTEGAGGETGNMRKTPCVVASVEAMRVGWGVGRTAGRLEELREDSGK